jgi:heme-degrading monooxygenase HmoA
MYTRVLTFTGVSDVDAAVSVVRDSALSVVRSQRGYQGVIASADRSGGVFGILSRWESEADRDASESALAKTREATQQRIGGELTVEMFEERVVEIAQPPTPGSALMVTRFRVDPAKIDETLEFFEREVAPQIAAAPGFRTLRNMINPQTGEGIVGTVWDDQQTMEAAAEAAQTRRAEATTRGVSFGEISYREIVFTDLP